MKIINFLKQGSANDTEIEYNGITKYIPLIICGGFYLITILLFKFGPFEWNIKNETQLYIFLSATIIALTSGYIVGTKIKFKKKKISVNANHIMYISFTVYLISYILNCYSTTGKFYPDVIRGILNSGLAYKTSHNVIVSIYYFTILLSPLTSLILPLLFIYSKSLNKKSKIMGWTTIILSISMGVAQGVINSYAKSSFQISMFLLIYMFSNIKKITIKKIIIILTTILVLFTSFFIYYKTVMKNRLIWDSKTSNNKTEQKIDNQQQNTNIINQKENKQQNTDKEKKQQENNKKIENEKPDNNRVNEMFNESSEHITQAKTKDKYFYSFLPNSIKSSLNHMVSYLTHGYKGLSLSLQKKFTSSYGLGSSDFFRHNLLKVIGQQEHEEEIYHRTYMYKIMDDGWATGTVWVTFFVFPASDIGFPMTVVLIFFMGMIFSLAWRDSIESKNIFAASLFIFMCMIICSFCANNVYLQNGGTFLSIMFVTMLWIITRKIGKEV